MLKIEIVASHDGNGTFEQQIETSMAALGFYRTAVPTPAADTPEPEPETAPEAPATAPEAPVRLVGEAGDGRKRRNSDEKADDDRIEALAAKAGLTVDQVNDALKSVGDRETVVEKINERIASAGEEGAQISTGEERVGPEDEPETQAQDAADEAAESAAAAPDKLTRDDIRTALGGYVDKFGMAAAQADGPKVIAMVCGEGKVKISDVPDDQDTIRKVIDGVIEMTAKNPYQRDLIRKGEEL